MVPIDERTSRYRLSVVRAANRRRAALAALALVPGLACSSYDDAEVFRSATTIPTDSVDTAATTTEPLTPASPPGSEAATSTDTVTEAESESESEADADADADADSVAFASGAELAVSFTFTPTAGGRRIENPFIAVWVEDTSGNLVTTISLWYEQSEEAPKWLSHLSRWTSATNAAVDATTSSATRVPGDYTVAWDGAGDDGAVVPAGDYVLFVEAARRGGAYDVTTTPMTIGADGFVVQLPDSGELTAVSAELMA